MHVSYMGEMGNQLFQFVLGRILSEELGFSLQADAIPGFASTEGFSRADVTSVEPDEICQGQVIDLATLRRNHNPRSIRLQGYFQRYEYYRPYKHLIRERWLKPLPSVAPPPAADDLVVHVRRKDYIAYGWAAPFSYYQTAIESQNFNRLVIVTDDLKDPFFWRFRSYQPVFFEGNALDSFAYLAHANRLVISQSSFSWWAAFLSEAESVVMPKLSYGIWAEPDVDLTID
ncbi:MAG: alpha-1,2-fucosyltransferase, partial [Cyanobium sp.]